jgi:hypothetical protein
MSLYEWRKQHSITPYVAKQNTIRTFHTDPLERTVSFHKHTRSYDHIHYRAEQGKLFAITDLWRDRFQCCLRDVCLVLRSVGAKVRHSSVAMETNTPHYHTFTLGHQRARCDECVNEWDTAHQGPLYTNTAYNREMYRSLRNFRLPQQRTIQINMVYEHKLCYRSRTSEQSFVSVCRVYSVSINLTHMTNSR